MADKVDAPMKKKPKRMFKSVSNDKKKLLEGTKAASTHKATEIYVQALRHYLKEEKDIMLLEEVLDADLPDILLDFYMQIKPINGDTYAIQSLKCIRAALNRYFKKEIKIDIISNSQFIETNQMFKGVTVKAKAEGKGVTVSMKPIAPEDLQIITEYFRQNYMQKPEPKILQITVLFYIIYYFCRRGHENLYTMETDTFKVAEDSNGNEYIYQFKDEKDKNHHPNDTKPTNEAKIYAVPGK